MALNREKLAALAQPRSESEKARALYRKENREWLRKSQEIALCLHYHLRSAGMTQKKLADQMGVSAVYVNKLLKGGENLTLETICKIQQALGEDIISIVKPYVCWTATSSSSSPVAFPPNSFKSDRYTHQPEPSNEYVPIMILSTFENEVA